MNHSPRFESFNSEICKDGADHPAATFASQAALCLSDKDDYGATTASTVAADNGKLEVVDVTKLGAQKRRVFVEKLIKSIQNDNLGLLKKIRERTNKQFDYCKKVRYQNLHAEADCKVVDGMPLPTLWNSLKSLLPVPEDLLVFCTAFEIVPCLQQLVQIADVTALVSLLQPTPEIFHLFYELILMSEGKIVYHGPCDHALEFFEDCGFRCPGRKGIAGFLQELACKGTSSFQEEFLWLSIQNFSGGYLKAQETFSRVLGYCEQTDIYSPFITVEESVVFSAWLRLPPQIDTDIKSVSPRTEYVAEVLEIIGLDVIKDATVGVHGVSGLSTEKRKQLTIAVELVANPFIIFMDEPTTGLDARSAAIVIQAMRNIGDTGRTIVCTIHQPSINIFEAFDEVNQFFIHKLIVEYFESIPGVPKIRNDYNPATWMLEVTSSGVDFAQIYKAQQGACKAVKFPTSRCPSYNLTRLMNTLASSLIFGILYWNQGKNVNDQQNLFNILGSMFLFVIFLGISNCSPAFSYMETERTVMYRERFAQMYSPWPHSLAQVIVEVPYLFVQAVVFVSITYPMIGYYVSVFKVSWYFYAMFCSLLYFNYMGMLLLSLTPDFVAAGILASPIYIMFNLFSGFIIPRPVTQKLTDQLNFAYN
ncbi:hypothetical protein FNV43_RR05179 [Rhamnella rubrinervis]|uniref:ABC transporter domain-containing protein n=1 Tax=Rhamnella rubrinervis TaxID=2594499 RepID=A0A8K0MQ83_9ROSA|nr:hypothetical protein FNV43_RR05179 [Rhamnella rubrinervis]